MLKRRPAINPDGTDTTHLMQLFDSDLSLADNVAHFVGQGLARDEQVLVVMSAERWNAVAIRLALLGCPVDDALRFGQLVVRDADEVLMQFMVGDKPHPHQFFATVGSLIEAQSACGRPLRVYGEMVDVLIAQGQYAAALELEELWNGLADRHPFTLLCGYTSGHFGDPHSAADLRRICAAHGSIAVDPEDVLASFLVNRF
jgi:hypothetical protein